MHAVDAREAALLAARQIRLVAVDLDGTLLDHARQLIPANSEAVRACVGAGLAVVLASGRIRPSMAPYAEALALSGPFICANGAHLVGGAGETLSFRPLAPVVVQKVVEYADLHRLHLNLYTQDSLYFLADTEWGDLYRSRASSLAPTMLDRADLSAKEIAKLMLIADPSAIEGHAIEIKKHLSGLPVQLTESEPEYLEFLAPGVDKGTALELLASKLEIPLSSVAAIGDYLNDIGMIQRAGLGAAVSSGHSETIRAARLVVGASDDAGAAEFLNLLLEARRQ